MSILRRRTDCGPPGVCSHAPGGAGVRGHVVVVFDPLGPGVSPVVAMMFTFAWPSGVFTRTLDALESSLTVEVLPGNESSGCRTLGVAAHAPGGRGVFIIVKLPGAFVITGV